MSNSYLLFVYFTCISATMLSVSRSTAVAAGGQELGAYAALTTAPPDLRRGIRDRVKRAAPDYECGVVEGITLSCANHNNVCRASIFSNGQAFQYCSIPGLSAQSPVYTTATGYPYTTSCPVGQLCCAKPTGYAVTVEFVASPYTVTGFVCQSGNGGTFTGVPAPKLLNPSGFKATLASLLLTGSTSSSTTSSTTTKPSPHTRTSPAPTHHSSGLSTGTKIGIGAGVAGAAAIILLGVIVYLCMRQRKKRQRQEAMREVSTSNTGARSSVPPYSPPMGYSQSQYFERAGSPSQFSTKPEGTRASSVNAHELRGHSGQD